MPIVDIEVVTSSSDAMAGKEQLQSLADELGDLFGSEPGDTWIRLRSIDRRGYAENRTLVDGNVHPTFVSVLRYEFAGCARAAPGDGRHRRSRRPDPRPAPGKRARAVFPRRQRADRVWREIGGVAGTRAASRHIAELVPLARRWNK